MRARLDGFGATYLSLNDKIEGRALQARCNFFLWPSWPIEEDGEAIRRTLRVLIDCKLHLNRDRMAAHNIATNYARLARGDPPLRAHSAEDAELNRLQCAMCSEE